MIENAVLVGLMVALGIGAVLTWFSSMESVGTAAHFGRHDAVSVEELRRRIEAERHANQRAVQVNSWLTGWSHDAPESVLTAAQAYDVMQLHRECRMENCDRKRAAYWALVAEGRIRPDMRAEQADIRSY